MHPKTKSTIIYKFINLIRLINPKNNQNPGVMKKILIFCLCVIIGSSFYSCRNNSKTSAGSDEGLATLAKKIRSDFYLGSFASGLNPSSPSFDTVSEIFKNNFNIMTIGVYMSGTQRERGHITWKE